MTKKEALNNYGTESINSGSAGKVIWAWGNQRLKKVDGKHELDLSKEWNPVQAKEEFEQLQLLF